MTKTFKTLKTRMDYNKYGGAVLLGCKKLVVKGHGSSGAYSITSCIEQVYKMSKGNLVENIASELSTLGIEEDE